MALFENIVSHGTVAAALLLAYLLPIMRFTSPRIWGFSDYPKEITTRVPPQTDREAKLARIFFIPFSILMIGIPFVSTLLLEPAYVQPIPLLDAFLNSFGVLMFGNLADLIVLDLLIVGTITPSWVIIPGTEDMKDTAYKDFRKSHVKGHVYGTAFLAILSLVIALMVVII